MRGVAGDSEAVARGTHVITTDGRLVGTLRPAHGPHHRIEARLADGMIDLELMERRESPGRVMSFLGVRTAGSPAR